ncbi:maleylpyruvate isomerase N-terminal domain-containing protein [Streptomyces sp. NPDC053513]|uniref:maleylpyruvate isomerase N-terminal domain-containing protein n=1 Tax=unclassified Streptomyces TaxID=2593676 RepID=UPI0037D782D6
MSDALLSALAESLAELVTAVGTSDDEVLDPGTAVRWLEGTAAALDGLGPADRRALDGLFRATALRRPAGPRREALLRLPERLGLAEGLRQAPPAATVPTGAVPTGAASTATVTTAPPLVARRVPSPTVSPSPTVPRAPHAAVGISSSPSPATPAAASPADDPADVCDAVAERVLRFAALVREADPATPVPTCPGWTLADLTRHLGAVHRWADHLVRTRATVRVHLKDLPLDPPSHPAAYADWLTEGAATVLTTLRATAPDLPVWSPGADPHARYYPRRLLSEAVVHLADAELALGGAAGAIDPRTAADAIDHFLTDAPYIPWIAEPLAHLGRDGAVLRLAARDTGTVRTLVLGGGGFTWTREGRGSGAVGPTASVEADTGELLLLLHRRYAADDPRFTHTGDRELLDDWLAATAL